MNRVRGNQRTLPLVPQRPSPPAASPAVRSNSVPSKQEWDLIARFCSSVPKHSVSEILGSTVKAKPGVATSRIVDALNAETLKNVGTGLQSAPARLATIAPLLSGAKEAHKAKILAELGLGGVPVSAAMAAIDALIKESAVHTALWIRPDFKVAESFEKDVNERLGTEIVSVEPNEVKGAVDGWSFGWTHGRLVDLVPESALKDKQVVVTSAMPVDPLWQTAFNAKDTVEKYPFDKQDGSRPVDQVMMTGAIDCTATTAENYRAAAIPLNNGSSLIAVVPAAGVPVSTITQALSNPRALQKFFSNFEPTHGTVYVPKMRVVGATDVSASLGPATKGPYEAVGSKPLTIGGALAATSIKLDEQGIAHAGGGSVHLAGNEAPTIIACARPFLFMLRNDATGLIVSAGIYRGPEAPPANSRAPRSDAQR
jgi:serine protease inhibitor